MSTLLCTEEEKQAELNLRSQVITKALKDAGWRFDASAGVYRRGDVRVYVQAGSQHIQRILRLDIQAYAQYLVKTVNTVADIVHDSLAVEVSETLAQLHAAIERAESALLQAA